MSSSDATTTGALGRYGQVVRELSHSQAKDEHEHYETVATTEPSSALNMQRFSSHAATERLDRYGQIEHDHEHEPAEQTTMLSPPPPLPTRVRWRWPTIQKHPTSASYRSRRRGSIIPTRTCMWGQYSY
jgi:hypothetical protein